MEQKTSIQAKEGEQDLWITREFDIPVALLFKAHAETYLLEQWMGTKVLKLESKKHGSFLFETSGPNGKTYRFHGVIHAFKPNKNITRTFEFEDMPFGTQLEFLEFEPLTNQTSRLKMHIIYQSATHRAEQLKWPFAIGLNMAHNRLEKTLKQWKKEEK